MESELFFCFCENTGEMRNKNAEMRNLDAGSPGILGLPRRKLLAKTGGLREVERGERRVGAQTAL